MSNFLNNSGSNRSKLLSDQELLNHSEWYESNPELISPFNEINDYDESNEKCYGLLDIHIHEEEKSELDEIISRVEIKNGSDEFTTSFSLRDEIIGLGHTFSDLNYGRIHHRISDRILIYHGTVSKRGSEAIVKRTNKRHLYLFNDILLVCSFGQVIDNTNNSDNKQKKKGYLSGMMKKAKGVLSSNNNDNKQIIVHQAVPIALSCVRDPSISGHFLPHSSFRLGEEDSEEKEFDNDENNESKSNLVADPKAFEVIGPHRSFYFIAENEQEKLRWIRELKYATWACYKDIKLADQILSIQEKKRKNMTDLLENNDDNEKKDDENKQNEIIDPNQKYNEMKPIMEIGWRHRIFQGTIHSAAKLGDIQLLKLIMDRLNDLEGEKKSDHGSRSPTKTVLASENFINSADKIGMSALHYAALNGHQSCLNLLLSNDEIQVYITNRSLNQPIHLAAPKGYDEIVNTLLENGAYPNCKNVEGRTPLFLTLIYGDCENKKKNIKRILNTLIRYGSDINELDTNNIHPLQICVKKNKYQMIKILNEMNIDMYCLDSNGNNLIQIACLQEKPDIRMISELAKAGLFVNWKNNDGKSAMDLLLGGGGGEHITGSIVNDDQNGRVSIEYSSNRIFLVMEAALTLIKYGSSYDLTSLSYGSNSIRQAVEKASSEWTNKLEDEEIKEYISNITFPNAEENWMDDNSSKVCIACKSQFTMTHRRHHCRICGILVCAGCSGKKLSAFDKKTKLIKPQRSCNACFTKIHNRLMLYKEQERLKRENENNNNNNDPTTDRNNSKRRSVKDGHQKLRDVLFGNRGKSHDERHGDNNLVSDDLKSTMSDTRNQLLLRGEKLEQINDRAGDLNNAAQDFRSAARKIREKQEKKKKWF